MIHKRKSCGLEIVGSRNSLRKVGRKSWGRSPCTLAWVKYWKYGLDSERIDSTPLFLLTNKLTKSKIIRFSSTAWRRFWLGHSPKVPYNQRLMRNEYVVMSRQLLSINIVMDETDKKLSMPSVWDLWRKSKCRIDYVIKVWDNLSWSETFFEKSKYWKCINAIPFICWIYLHYNINYVASRRISDEKMEEDVQSNHTYHHVREWRLLGVNVG
jgi:hypothetical protein